jgi:hypothetical protein
MNRTTGSHHWIAPTLSVPDVTDVAKALSPLTSSQSTAGQWRSHVPVFSRLNFRLTIDGRACMTKLIRASNPEQIVRP